MCLASIAYSVSVVPKRLPPLGLGNVPPPFPVGARYPPAPVLPALLRGFMLGVICVATKSIKFGARSLTTYCSGFLPSLSFTMTLTSLLGSMYCHFCVSGSLMKNASPYLNVLRNIRKIRVSNLLVFTHCCRYSPRILISLLVAFLRH